MNYFYVKGITLFELISTLSIVSILSMFAIPHFHNMLEQQERQKVIFIIKQSFQYAKTEALLNRRRIVICASIDGKQCNDDQWSSGFIIFSDQNTDNQVNTDETIYVHQVLDLKYGELKWQGALSRKNVFFNAQQGLPNGSNGSFYYCSTRVSEHQRIVLSRMGHSRHETSNNC
jgi:type IV fimbrial biogenesis protein FimT